MNKTDGPVVGQLINNFRFPISFPRENIEFALNYKPQNDDKFLVTYPKCGTTWAQQIICLIINNGIIEKIDRPYVTNSLFEREGKEALNTIIKPIVIKTHLPFGLIPYNESAKYLCVLRNPKDVCVSYYYHTKGRAHYQFDGDFHEYFDCWIKGEIPYGDYFQHILSFWSHRFDDNFNFLLYEHMKNNPKDSVLKIAEFLGEKFVIKLKENNELMLNKVVENSSMDAMKTMNYSILIRKGIVGDWKNHFNKTESDLVDEKVTKLFTGTGLENLWSEEMKW
jgi:hypothetical protein